MRTTLQKLEILSITLLFALVMGSIITSCSFFARHEMNMHSNTDMTMRIDGETAACCQMTNHHNPLQNIAADVASKLSAAGNYLEVAMSFVLLFMGFWLLADKTLSTYLYRLRRILSITSNYLVQAFSQGILQPQIYNA